MKFFKYGSIFIIIQNLLLIIVLLLLFLARGAPGSIIGTGFGILIIASIFTLDLIGYTFLVVGGIKLANKVPTMTKRFKIFTITLSSWIIIRLIVQITVFLWLYMDTQLEIGDLMAANAFVIIGVSGTLILISGLSRINRYYTFYCIANFTGYVLLILTFYNQFIIFAPLGFILKFIIAPVLSIMAFVSIFRTDWFEITYDQVTMETYPASK